MGNSEVEDYIAALKSSRKFGIQIVCHKTIEPVPADYAPLPGGLHPGIEGSLKKAKISRLYLHQSRAIELVQRGKDVVVATPTASGKSLVYHIPTLQRYLDEQDSRALYMFPLKALAQDQRRALLEFYAHACGGASEGSLFAAVYDGDTKPNLRSKLRKHPPPVIITNPDMVHLSMLPYHDSWSAFFRTLKFIVIDEIHTYRGLFGAHMSWILKRLIRVANHYGARPTFIMLSATVGNPGELCAKLIGRKVEVVTENGAPSGQKHMILLNPWDSAAHTTTQLLEAALKRGLRTIVYTKSRKMTELITMWTRSRVGALADKLSSYRAGFLPEDRRNIERRLASGELLGVISTSALELGIDIGDLDLCILVGYPGSIMATWQRSGRVGRRSYESAVIMVGGEDALDQYFMRNPDDFFAREPEHAPLNPFNSKISGQHLHCAAAELSIARKEPLVTSSETVQKQIDELTDQSVLHLDAGGERWYSSRKRPQNQISIRGGGIQLLIIDKPSGEIIGEIDAGRALKETHPGAVYLHHSRILLVDHLDIDSREVVVEEFRSHFHTRPHVQKETEILECYQSKQVMGCRVSWGRLKVREQVTGYSKVNNFTLKVASTSPLDLPEQVVETEGLWLDLREDQRSHLEDRHMHFMGAIHALEHAMIAMFPLLILCDRNDIGGISCPHHPQTDRASIFIYDGYGGGAGLSEEAYELIDKLLIETARTIQSCHCETGCPSCVHSPKCGSGNRPIDKAASLILVASIINSSNDIRKEIPTVIEVSTEEGSDRQVCVPSIRGLAALPKHYCVFDLETKRSAQECGGWNMAHRMGVSVGVLYDSQLDEYVTYFEDEIDHLVDHLFNCELAVGFNIKRFDYQVLSAYTRRHFHDHPTLDLLEEIHNQLGYRLGLNRLVEETLGLRKTADGVQALAWYKEGKLREIADYCREDVKLTRNLFLYALECSHLLFRNKAGKSVRLPLPLDQRIAEIVKGPENQGQSSGL
ncbi:MAG: DEAD/DEAH box helicase [Desulfofustis sp.]|nr:DEAD/DEAH box helicase [Desulfofustis sp.]